MRSQPAVLVIDDDRNFCRILEVKLRRSAFAVTLVHDAASANSALLAQEYGIVLLDLRLPDADGLAMLPRLKAAAGAAPILVITAYEEDQLRARALESGAVDVLFKPFDLDLLVQTVRRQIEAANQVSAVLEGQLVQLDREGEPGRWRARVRASDADTFWVVVEPGSGFGVPLATGDALRVTLTGADGLYAFRARVRRAEPGGEIQLAKPGLIRRLQRRRHPRAPLHGVVEMRMAGGQTVSAMARDVSLGGMGLVTDKAVAVGDAIEASWQLATAANKSVPIDAAAAVVRCDSVWEGDGEALCRVGLEFTELPAPTRRRIASYVSRQS